MRSVSLLMFVALAACGGKRKPAAQPAPPPPPPPAETQVVASDEPLPPPEEVAPPGFQSTGVFECDEYIQVLQDFTTRCEKQLGPAKDAMIQAMEAYRTGFADIQKMPPEQRAAALDAARTGCKAATDALKTAASSMSCL